MAVYILDEYPIKMPDGSKPCIMTADNEYQLHAMAELIHVDSSKFSDSNGKFYVVSRTQMKKAIVNGALHGKQAREVIRYKNFFPITQQMD